MTIERGDFDAISIEDIEELVEGQVSEGLRLEYKKELYGASDGDKRELLKDTSSFANSHGGHIVLGIEEANGAADRLLGAECPDPDAELLRMEHIVRNGLEPVVSGIRMRAIPIDTDRYLFLLRVPRSWRPPHRVVAKGINRFYVRNSAGVHEPSVEELRSLFTQSASVLEQARRFRDDRITSVCSGEGPRPLVAGGRLFLHIFPAAAHTGVVNLDMEAVHAQHNAFRPLGTMGMTPRFNYHGFVNERGGDENYGYTQVFRNGCLEATKASIVREREGHRGISGLGLEEHIFEVLSSYIKGLRDVGVPPPLIIMFTLEGVLGANYHVRRNLWDDYEPPLPDDILRLPECTLEDYGEDIDHHRSVRPAFDALWNAIGYSRSQSFNDDGLWNGAGQR